MPLKLTLDRVQPHAPLRDQIADGIRRAIASGELQPGEALDSEQQIADSIKVDKATVRRAVDLVADEGLLLKTNGKRTTVAPPAPVRRMDASRYLAELDRLRAGQPPSTAFITDHGATWDDYTMDPLIYTEELATEFHAKHLRVPVGELLIKRFAVKKLSGKPIQIQVSFISYEHAFGTLLADPSVQPYPGGTLAELYAVGLIDGKRLAVAEEWGVFPATTEERRLLDMRHRGGVFNIVRVISADDVPIEMSQVIAPAGLTMLRFETEIS